MELYPIKIRIEVEKNGEKVSGEMELKYGDELPKIQSLASKLIDELCIKLGIVRVKKRSKRSRTKKGVEDLEKELEKW